jgi:hypothetical protein
LLVLDAKYMNNITNDDLNQIWIYCIVWSLTDGVLIYPKHMISQDETRTLKELGINIEIKNIDLRRPTLKEFERECNRFVDEVEMILQTLSRD